MSEKEVFGYPGKEIDVQWDGRLCIHIGECGNARGDLFVGGRDPWCIPDTSTKAEVREIVERCPSGALSYRDKEGVAEVPAEENTVTVAYNGPLYARGELAIEGAPEDMPGVRFRAALCRCGRSANKPFCDNTHIEVGFQDYGSVGERGPGLTAKGGPLTIKTHHLTGRWSSTATSPSAQPADASPGKATRLPCAAAAAPRINPSATVLTGPSGSRPSEPSRARIARVPSPRSGPRNWDGSRLRGGAPEYSSPSKPISA